MELFELKEYNLTYSPQALALEPFKKLWDRDKSKDKQIAIAELSFIYFFADYKSDFSDILDEHKRAEEILDAISLPKGWKPDAAVYAAIKFYQDRSYTVTMRMLESAHKAINKLNKYFDNVNPLEKDSQGKLVHDAKKLVDTIGNLGKVVDGLKELEDRVKKEKEKKGRLRAGREKGLFEDGF